MHGIVLLIESGPHPNSSMSRLTKKQIFPFVTGAPQISLPSWRAWAFSFPNWNLSAFSSMNLNASETKLNHQLLQFQGCQFYYLGFSLLWRDTMIMWTLINKIFIGVTCLQLQGLKNYHHDGEHRSMQADVVLELRVLHLAGNRKITETLSNILSTGNLKAHSNNNILPSKRPFPYQ